MTWTSLYLVCFLLGFSLSAVSWLIGALHLHLPFRGVASTIFVAFVGAVALLLIMRLVRRTTGRGR